MRHTVLILSALSLAACAGIGPGPSENAAAPAALEPATNTTDLRFGNGYRSANDACRRVGRSEFTAPFLTPDTDLVGCPVDFEGRADFIKATNAREATRTADWVLYSVPLVGTAPTAIIPTAPPITGG